MDDWKNEYTEIATLAGGFAHEIRNPLSTILLNVDVVAEELAEGDSPRDRRLMKKLDRVTTECKHLQQIVNAFLLFAKSSMVQSQPTDVTAAITEYLDAFEADAAESGITLSPHLAADLPQVELDPALFRQVLANLCRNAKQAMPDGGTLEVAARLDNAHVLVEVIDTGCGMTAEQMDHMFEAFWTTKNNSVVDAGGTGLGLPTVRKIIDAHGGTIACDSEPGQGTRFRIRLPIATE